MADETNPILAVLERARVEPWRVGHDGPSRPIIEPGRIKYSMLSLSAFCAGKWEWYDDEETDAAAIVLAVNHHAALREALVAQSNAVEELLATQAIPVVVWAGLQDVLDQARAVLRALDEAVGS